MNREDIARGSAELQRPIEDLIAGVIAALQNDAQRLGLAGESSALHVAVADNQTGAA